MQLAENKPLHGYMSYRDKLTLRFVFAPEEGSLITLLT